MLIISQFFINGYIYLQQSLAKAKLILKSAYLKIKLTLATKKARAKKYQMDSQVESQTNLPLQINRRWNHYSKDSGKGLLREVSLDQSGTARLREAKEEQKAEETQRQNMILIKVQGTFEQEFSMVNTSSLGTAPKETARI